MTSNPLYETQVDGEGPSRSTTYIARRVHVLSTEPEFYRETMGNYYGSWHAKVRYMVVELRVQRDRGSELAEVINQSPEKTIDITTNGTGVNKAWRKIRDRIRTKEGGLEILMALPEPENIEPKLKLIK
ncbi:hypothetical protein HN419_04190 [Candidatus Woesearchaeota archaeon]|jgi:hypothetical protein|nr:hypothetical protein [Candidatus Woesearchaeota archaeon]MBT3537923.1 hypothetical protein [Candidatus Woesearchaeota archaeon]MBT4698061.1 hypothetical protein [Candidatus Woesearchaeota archaeon]MBT4716526.1 hypothetical protein [Candidatus Woesearchaeota archaeon]MBT7105592.1 hypothetical protein [Candidatus Woesearchaeota archaeon]